MVQISFGKHFVARHRLINQHIAQPSFESAAQVLQSLCAIQAQDYLGALWAIALRTVASTEADIEQAIADRQIVRSWPMRGTIHFVAAADLRWMLALLAPRVMRGVQSRLRQLEIDTQLLVHSADIISKALIGGKQMTRPALYDCLARAGISASGSRGLHILGQLSMQGLLCFGSREGKQPTFTLLDEWIAPTRALDHQEALAQLVLRYFTGHGPATIQDCMWWSGLTATEVRTGLSMLGSQLAHDLIADQEYYFAPELRDFTLDPQQAFLLAPFDELLLGYRDRSASLDPAHNTLVAPGSNGIFNPIIVIDGQVVGTWKRTLKRHGVELAFIPFDSFDTAQHAAIRSAGSRYAAFLDLPVRFPASEK